MTDLKSLRAEIKPRLDRHVVIGLLTYAGVEVMRDHHFKDNPSFSIRRDGLIKDFGSTGFCGDLIAYMHEQMGYSLPEATLWVADCLEVAHG